MKAKLMYQSDLDIKEQTDRLEDLIELSTFPIMLSLNKKVTIEKKISSNKAIATMGLSMLLIIGIILNKKAIYSLTIELIVNATKAEGLNVDERQAHRSETINPIKFNWPTQLGETDNYVMVKTFSSLDEAETNLQLDFLQSDMEWDYDYQGKVQIDLPQAVMNCVVITVRNYIVGDMKLLELSDEGIERSETGDIYHSAIDLKVRFLYENAANLEHTVYAISNSYATDEFVETYVNSSGRITDIYKSKHSTTEESILPEPFVAVFVEKNMQYSIIGCVNLRELKKIIDSFH